MTALELRLVEQPSEAERRALAEGLGGYNEAAYGPLARAACWLLACDAAGALQAGAKCEEAWRWLYVDWLWVAKPLRHQGWGGRLLAAAEVHARERGLLGLHLNTWSFQAPNFYRKQGFTCVGQVADMPPGATRYWFAKRFDGGEP